MPRTTSLLLLAALLLPAAPLAAQGAPDSSRDYDQALDQLAAGDTTAAVALLRRAVKERPEFGPAHLRLGSILSAQATEVDTDFGGRSEAERLLERAFRLMGGDPEVLLEYGLLLRKKQMRVDAKRLLDRAWTTAERRGESMAPADRARLHYELGKIYETWWEDWQGLVQKTPTTPVINCARVDQDVPRPDYEMAVACPESFARQLEGLVPLADLKSEEHRRMLEHFRKAVDADPRLADAAVRLLGHLADAGEWEPYEQVSRKLLEQLPEDPRAHLFLALGLHERGRHGEASAAFTRAVELLPPDERHVFHDISPLLPTGARERYAGADSAGREEVSRLFFTAKDPLFLTDGSERLLEHYARLAWAELKFSAPASELRGWDTDRGRIWVRYGAPGHSHQCCYGQKDSVGSIRHVYWSYGSQGPVFTFARNRSYRNARLTEVAHALADDLERSAPELYQPRTITAVHEIPHQVARFRGGAGDLTRVEIYAGLPLDSLAAEPGSLLETGVFAFLDDYTPIWDRRDSVSVGNLPVGLTYRLDLPAGRFRYGLEARLAGPDTSARPAARARESLVTQLFEPGRLAISDLLLAVVPVTARRPSATAREDLVIAPLRGTAIGAGEPIHLFFEIYGLETDAAGVARYRAELAVEDSTRRNVAQRLLRAGRELVGAGAGDTRVSWERQATPVDDVVPEYLSIEVPRLDPGEYVVRIRIMDDVSGRAVVRVRSFTVKPEEP